MARKVSCRYLLIGTATPFFEDTPGVLYRQRSPSGHSGVVGAPGSRRLLSRDPGGRQRDEDLAVPLGHLVHRDGLRGGQQGDRACCEAEPRPVSLALDLVVLDPAGGQGTLLVRAAV